MKSKITIDELEKRQDVITESAEYLATSWLLAQKCLTVGAIPCDCIPIT